MKNVEIHCNLTEYESVDELDLDDRELLVEAKASMNKAYAPYSHFHVGAAIMLENGIILRGNNQENASYPIGLCAERVAVFQAGSIYPEAKILKMAITAASDTNQTAAPIPPCGSCRQSIAEYEIKQDTPIEIYFMGEIGTIYKSNSLKNLLPFMFDKNFL
mgnify:CR=1 FL=1